MEYTTWKLWVVVGTLFSSVEWGSVIDAVCFAVRYHVCDFVGDIASVNRLVCPQWQVLPL